MPFRNDLFLGRFGLNPRYEDTDLLLDEPVARMIGRRVCRHYGREAVTDGMLETLLAAAQSAPAKSDLQQYAIVVTDKGQQQAISDMIGSMPWIAEASRFLVFCADMHRGQRIAEMRGKEHVNNTLDTFMNAAVDASLAMMSFITAAGFKGLGTCPVSAVRAHTAAVCELLGLPKGVYPVAGLTVGYPTDDGRFTLRLPPSVVVHHGTYDDSALETELKAYDARRNKLQPIAPEKQMHKDDFGISDDYGWTENTARRLAKRERAEFGAFIRSHGFDLE
ncbi:nitroreductase family protein [Thalassospiraceae bacterium LMO-SO8]|nr:nitroreductase family protein [Alphaproteobacteria bacterium LMO-S08]WND75046.1 nitroreductase family protein [Thalassospiraceae bacterium LMO-SO8]